MREAEEVGDVGDAVGDAARRDCSRSKVLAGVAGEWVEGEDVDAVEDVFCSLESCRAIKCFFHRVLIDLSSFLGLLMVVLVCLS